MFIVDYSQTSMSNFLRYHSTKPKKEPISEDFVRHLILSSILSYNKKFKSKYGEMVLAIDCPWNWRKGIFPNYKWKRAEDRKASEIDWDEAYRILNKIRDEIRDVFPYRFVYVENCEADDVIASLCHKFGNTNEKILIMSNDKDFIQLLKYNNVELYQHNKKTIIKGGNSPTKTVDSFFSENE